jgi:hypothetical protein
MLFLPFKIFTFYYYRERETRILFDIYILHYNKRRKYKIIVFYLNKLYYKRNRISFYISRPPDTFLRKESPRHNTYYKSFFTKGEAAAYFNMWDGSFDKIPEKRPDIDILINNKSAVRTTPYVRRQRLQRSQIQDQKQ